MSSLIWYHGEHKEEHVALVHPLSNCQYCDTPMLEDEYEGRLLMETPPFRLFARVIGFSGMGVNTSAAVCPSCGWWKYTRYYDFMGPTSGLEVFHDGWYGILKKIDVANIGTPCDEVYQYITAKFDERFNVHPQKMEEVVASVFRNLGYNARVTAYSNDGGIDVFLDGPDDTLIGVQVKRYRNSIQVDQIRELTGALVLNGLTKGIFVTTSDFQAGAHSIVDLAALRGIKIELMNSDRLFDALKLTRIASYMDAEEELPWQGFKEKLAKAVEAEMEARIRREQADRDDSELDFIKLAREIPNEEDRLLMQQLRSRRPKRE